MIPGTLLKGYKIVNKIRDGSVGSIYKAEDSAGRTVAIKQISPRGAADSRKLKAFKREATITKTLDHPYVIKVSEYVNHQPLPFFIMEYFRSENLKYTMIKLPDRLRNREFNILRKMAEAIAYVHDRGVVHRDIKPENFLVNEEGEVRLIDFSLAQTKWERILSFSGGVSGTPQYMSPEQVLGKRVDHRCDIYSFGATTFELLTRKPVFAGTSEKDLFQKHLTAPAPSLKQFIPSASDELDAVIRKTLEKDPAKRFDSLAPVIHEFSRWERKDTGVRTRQTNTMP